MPQEPLEDAKCQMQMQDAKGECNSAGQNAGGSPSPQMARKVPNARLRKARIVCKRAFPGAKI